jgi:hypothetical protein
VAWFGNLENIEWTGALLPFPVASRSPEIQIGNGHLVTDDDEEQRAKDKRARRHYRENPPEHVED